MEEKRVKSSLTVRRQYLISRALEEKVSDDEVSKIYRKVIEQFRIAAHGYITVGPLSSPDVLPLVEQRIQENIGLESQIVICPIVDGHLIIGLKPTDDASMSSVVYYFRKKHHYGIDRFPTCLIRDQDLKSQNVMLFFIRGKKEFETSTAEPIISHCLECAKKGLDRAEFVSVCSGDRSKFIEQMAEEGIKVKFTEWDGPTRFITFICSWGDDQTETETPLERELIFPNSEEGIKYQI